VRSIYTPPSEKALLQIAAASYQDLTTRTTWQTPLLRGKLFDFDSAFDLDVHAEFTHGLDNPAEIIDSLERLMTVGVALLAQPPFSRGWHRGWPTDYDYYRELDVEDLVSKSVQVRTVLKLNPDELTPAMALTAVMAMVTNLPRILARGHKYLATEHLTFPPSQTRRTSPPPRPPRPRPTQPIPPPPPPDRGDWRSLCKLPPA